MNTECALDTPDKYKEYIFAHGVWVMVFNATFNNILAVSWRSVLLVKEIEYPEKITDKKYTTTSLCKLKIQVQA